MVAVRNAVGALAGFFLAAALVYHLLPHRPSLVDERLEQGLLARETCEVLFIGPSYVWSNFEPEAFDAESKRIGLDARSCKFGVSALKGYDLKLNIERMLSHDWPRLRLVVIDITLGTGVAFAQENWFKPRVLEWHTWGSLPWLFDYYADDSRSWFEKAPLVSAHVRHVAAHYTRLGGGRDLLEDARPLERLLSTGWPRAKQGPDDDDEITRVEEMTVADEPARDAKAFARRLDAFTRKKEARRARRQKDSRADWPLELRELVRSHGREAYFLFAPVLYARAVPRAPLGQDRLVVLDFNDAQKYPELYRLEHRRDSHHLNEEGGRLYSKLIARELQTVGVGK